jgi:hypothetical protein
MTELELDDGTTILFSYETPVACSTVNGWFKTEQWYSRTTTKHVNKWLEGIKAQVKPQSFFATLVNWSV